MSLINSMTAFARVQSRGDWGSAIWELRSVNHRYLEIQVRLPEVWRDIEAAVRETIRQHMNRGKVDCTLHFNPGINSNITTELNQRLAKQLIADCNTLSAELPNAAPVSPLQVLRFPEVLRVIEQQDDAAREPLIKLLTEGLEKAVLARQSEGGVLKSLLMQRLEGIKVELTKLKGKIPEIITAEREKLLEKFGELTEQMDQTRLEQEMIFFAQKIDVDEELDRLDAHTAEVERVLDKGGVCGRRLDFLMQELNREANTIGSKSVAVLSTRAAVEIKVLIEQMREQVQNIE